MITQLVKKYFRDATSTCSEIKAEKCSDKNILALESKKLP